MPTHVVHVIETLGPGGAERALYTYLKHLDRSRFRHTVVTIFQDGDHWRAPILELDVPVVSLCCPSRREFAVAAARLYHLVRAERADLIHTQLWTSNIAGRLAGWLAGIPVVSSIQNMDYEPQAWHDHSMIGLRKRDLLRILDGWTAQLACRRLIAVSGFVRQSTHRHLRFPLDRIDLVYNPVDSSELQAPECHSRDELLREWGLPLTSRVLLHVGSVSPQKGVLYAIRALPSVREHYPEVHLVSVGGRGNRVWLERLEQEALALGVQDHIHLLGPRRDVPDLLRACDLFLFPSLYEGMPIALAEAMAMGCVCVATDVGPLPEIISNGSTGLLVPSADSEALAQAIRSLLEDPVKRASLGRAAAESAAAAFDPYALAARVEKIYEAVLETAGPVWPSRPAALLER